MKHITKGEFTFEFRDAIVQPDGTLVAGEISHTEGPFFNVVTALPFLRILEGAGLFNGATPAQVMVGAKNQNGPDQLYVNCFMNNSLASAGQQATYPHWAMDMTPRPDIEFYARISPPGSGTRTIDYVGLRLPNGGNLNRTLAYATLGSPVVQSTLQFLDVRYHLYVNDDLDAGNDNVAPAALSHLILTAAGLGLETAQFDNSLATAALLSTTKFAVSFFPQIEGISFEKTPATAIIETIGSTNTIYPNEGSAERNLVLEINDAVGKIIGGYKHVAGGVFPLASPISFGPIQNTFIHGAAAVSPFNDLSNLGTSPGLLTVGGNWAGQGFPQLVQVVLDTTGNVGVAQYRLRFRSITGFRGSSYLPAPAVIDVLPSVTRTTTPIVQYGEKVVYGFDRGVSVTGVNAHKHASSSLYRVIRVDEAKVASFNDAGITVVNLKTGDVVSYDANSTPALAVSEIRQIASDGAGVIYVAAGPDGLIKIDTFANTVNPTAEPTGVGINGGTCFAVDVKSTTGDVWGLFDGVLAQSVDGGATWTNFNGSSDPQFTYTGITDANWGLVNQILVDGYSADDRILFIMNGTSAWWDRVGSTPTSNAVAGPTGHDYLFVNKTARQHIGFLDSGDIMAVLSFDANEDRLYELSYGADTLTSVYNNFNLFGQTGLTIIKDSTGADRIYNVFNPSSPAAGTVGRLLDAAGSEVAVVLESDVTLAGDNAISMSSITYMGVGVLFGLSTATDFGETITGNLVYGILALGTADPFDANTKDVVWTDWGWDGANWIIDAPGYRLTHATAEDIPFGLTLQFADDGSDSFVGGEYFSFGLCYGLLKDDATSVPDGINLSVYLYPTVTGLTDIDSPTVPNVDAGAITDELIAFGRFDPPSITASTGLGLITSRGTLAGQIDTSVLNTTVAGSDQKLAGNLSLNFLLARGHLSKNQTVGASNWLIGLTAEPITVADLTESDFQEAFGFEYLSNNQVRVRIHRAASVVYNAVHTPYGVSGNDPALEFEIVRTGSNIEYFIGGVSVFTSPCLADPLVVGALNRGAAGLLAYDIRASYTSTQRLVGLGDGVSTGRNKSGFNRIALSGVSAKASLFGVSIDGNAPTFIHYDGTEPSSGEVTVLPALGKLWFSADDAGLNVTCLYSAIYEPGTVL